MPKAKVRKSKYVSYLLRFAVAALALYLTFRGEDFSKIKDELLGLNLWVFAASLGIWLLSQLVFVVRWSLLLKVQSINIGFWPAFRLHLLGVFYNNCLPTSIGGDLLRAGYVTTHTDKKLEAALSVFVDRIIGLIGMVIMAFLCYWFIPVDEQKERLTFSFNLNLWQRLNEHKLILLGVVVIFAGVLIACVSIAKSRNLLSGAFRIFREKVQMVLGKMYNAIRIYCRKKFALALALLLTFCCQAIFILGLWLIGWEIGIDVHVKYYFVFFPIAWLLGALPISIGALGIWEGTLKLLFSKIAIGFDAQISTLALCHRIIWLFGSLPGVVIHLIGAHLPGAPKRGKAGLGTPKDFFIDYDESID
jgi:uncharacterized protein (TIRG00374 family)